jgi:hypothetical protein
VSTGKGKKRIKNVPVLHEEPKKQRGILLTDTAWYSVLELAAINKVSASEYVEELIRKHCVTAAKAATHSSHG